MRKAQQEKVGTAKAKTPQKTATTKKRVAKKTTATSVGIKKEYLKSKNVCKVTFRLPKIAAPNAKTVCIVGEFNNWNIYANPMKRLRSGEFTIALELEPGREYQFRYLIDEYEWENDWNADKYVKGPYGDSDNSVVVV
jgi:1,4-alpha-glucan branching enzyme